jgi:hypothetical protein
VRTTQHAERGVNRSRRYDDVLVFGYLLTREYHELLHVIEDLAPPSVRFDETVRGIVNLGQLRQRIELRVVIHKQTAPALVDIADFIARNLPSLTRLL